jgi:hypothetical protein
VPSGLVGPVRWSASAGVPEPGVVCQPLVSPEWPDGPLVVLVTVVAAPEPKLCRWPSPWPGWRGVSLTGAPVAGPPARVVTVNLTRVVAADLVCVVTVDLAGMVAVDPGARAVRVTVALVHPVAGLIRAADARA